MKQNTALLLSLGVTVFILLIVAGVLNPQIVLGKSTNQAAAVDQAAIDQQVQQALAEREAAYNQLLTEANQRLEQANQQIQTMSQQVQQMQASPAAPSQSAQPVSSQYISVDAAQQAAQAVAGSASLTKAPELVSFEGKVAYEVAFDKGNVYVDATSGQVLMNETATQQPQEITKDQAVQIAEQYLGKTSIYLADTVTLSGHQVYRVIFNSGDFVYLDKTGQITYVQLYNPNANASQASFSGGGGGGGGGGGYHESEHHDGGDD